MPQKQALRLYKVNTLVLDIDFGVVVGSVILCIVLSKTSHAGYTS